MQAEEVREPLRRVATPTLVVGGTADSSWDTEFVSGLTGVDVVEILDADHGLEIPGDPIKSLEILRDVTGRIGLFVAGLARVSGLY